MRTLSWALALAFCAISSSAAAELAFLRQKDASWADANGQAQRLRGINIGNWLTMEFWMLDQAIESSAGPVPDQCSLEKELQGRFGFDEKERLMDAYRDNWMKARDWDLIQSLGFNLVRLPFSWHVIEDERKPYTLKEKAWKYLDQALDEAERRGLHVILDLHGAVGGQGWEAHTGCAGRNELWGNAAYRARTKWLWKEIAARYKDRSVVAGYGLLNEPWGTDSRRLADFSRELYHAIREVDQRHIVILPGHNTDGINAYGNPKDHGMHDVAFEAHFYPGFWGWGEGRDAIEVHREWLFCERGTDRGGVCDWNQKIQDLKTPFLIGEFQPWTLLGADAATVTAMHFNVYNALGWAATAWSYKTLSREGVTGGWPWGLVSNRAKAGLKTLNVSTANADDIESYFQNLGTIDLVPHESVRRALTRKAKISERIEAEHFQFQKGFAVERAHDDGPALNLGFNDDGSWASYPVEGLKAGTYELKLRVASPFSGGRVIISHQGRDLASATIPNTGAWQNWETLPIPVEISQDMHDISIYVATGGWNFNWFELVPR